MASLTVHLAIHSKWRAGVLEDANIARIGRTRGKAYTSNAVWTTGIINIIGKRKYTSGVFPCIQLLLLKAAASQNEASCNFCTFLQRMILRNDLLVAFPRVGHKVLACAANISAQIYERICAFAHQSDTFPYILYSLMHITLHVTYSTV